MGKIIRKSIKILSTVLVSIVILLALLLAGTRLIGLTPYTVLSGSMEPNYRVGSVIYVKKVDPATLKVGDPVTFHLSGDIVATHRITEVVNDKANGLSFVTQGDANDASDGASPASAIIGKPIFTIPYLGYISSFVQTPKGIICIVGGTAIILLISNLVDSLLSKQEKTKDKTEEEKIG